MQTSLRAKSIVTGSGLALFLGLAGVARADFTPVPLTPESFNQDMIVEKGASPPVLPVTTASMDAGTNNTALVWFERTYNESFPATGLPQPGAVFSSDSASDHDYQLAPSYTNNNVVLIDQALTTAALTLVSPAPYAGLSFLTSGGNGGGNIGYKVHHQDGTTESGTMACPGWETALNAAFTSYGRVNADLSAFDSINRNVGAMYGQDRAMTNPLSPVTSIDFSYVAGAGHCAVFAVSGSANPGDPFTPVQVTGYNQDVVVEASAPRAHPLSGATTASMDNGVLNGSTTWYEQGYVPTAPGTGLPPAGSTLVSATAPDHRFLLPPSYAENNAVLVDSDLPSTILTPAVPVKAAVLSFLGSAGTGPSVIGCLVYHADGSFETNALAVPVWFDASPAAFTASGRINLNNSVPAGLYDGSRKLFALDLALTNSISAITNLVLSFKSGALSHAAILAMSAQGTASAVPPVLTLALGPDRTLILGTSVPGRLQSATALNGSNTVWQEEGGISGSKVITPNLGEPARFYRVVAQ